MPPPDGGIGELAPPEGGFVTDALQPTTNIVAVSVNRSGLNQLKVGVAGSLRVIFVCLSVASFEARPCTTGRRLKRPVILSLGTQRRTEFHRNLDTIQVPAARHSAFPDHYDDNRQALCNQ